MQYKILENDEVKLLRSDVVNYDFNKKTGFMATWGKTPEENPDYSPVGPFIADIEISTICHGIQGKPCKFCYKSNTGVGENMSLETFKKVFHKLGPQITQIAFGIGSVSHQGELVNPDLWNILDYCRKNGKNYVVPNITINGEISEDDADKIVEHVGACAVSKYLPKDVCYDAVKKLTERGMTQCNIHMLSADEKYDECLEVMLDSKTDPRLEKLNAIVFLTLKKKGKRNNLNYLGSEKYKKIIDYAFENDIRIGFDSCSAPMFLEAVKDRSNFKELEQLSEPCESFGLYSCYIDVRGHYYPCSFIPNTLGWEEGIDLLKVDDFLKDVWNCPKVCKGRSESIACGRKCLPYPEIYDY